MSKPDAQERERVDSDEELLEAAQSSAPADCPFRDKPDSDRKARERAVQAWNKLAACNIEVVKTIKKNEARQELMAKRMRNMTFAVFAAVVIAMVGAFYLAVQAERAVDIMAANLTRQNAAANERTEKKLDTTLDAIAKLSEAIGLKLEADVDPSPGADEEAAQAALDAQEAALEAKKQVTHSPAERARTDKKIREVKEKAGRKKSPPSYLTADPESEFEK